MMKRYCSPALRSPAFVAFPRFTPVRHRHPSSALLCSPTFVNCHINSRQNKNKNGQFTISSTTMTTSKPTITFVTGNQNKLREVQQILCSTKDEVDAEAPFDLVARKLDLPELQGDPEDIAREKCRLAAEQVNGPTVSFFYFFFFLVFLSFFKKIVSL